MPYLLNSIFSLLNVVRLTLIAYIPCTLVDSHISNHTDSPYFYIMEIRLYLF